MKKLLLISGLLFSFFSFAQDGYKLAPEQYKEITDKITQLDSISAKSFSDKIANSAETSLVLENVKSNKRAIIFYYNEKDLTPEEKEKQEVKGCESCLTVIFLKNQNNLKLSEVRGLYKDIFPTWEREFLPGASPDIALENFRQREVKSREYSCNITIDITEDRCRIYNWN